MSKHTCPPVDPQHDPEIGKCFCRLDRMQPRPWPDGSFHTCGNCGGACFSPEALARELADETEQRKELATARDRHEEDATESDAEEVDELRTAGASALSSQLDYEQAALPDRQCSELELRKMRDKVDALRAEYMRACIKLSEMDSEEKYGWVETYDLRPLDPGRWIRAPKSATIKA